MSAHTATRNRWWNSPRLRADRRRMPDALAWTVYPAARVSYRLRRRMTGAFE